MVFIGGFHLIIRAMVNEDISEFQKMASDSFGNTYKNLLPEKIQKDFLDLSYSMNRLHQRMKSSKFYVAEIEKKIIGYVNFSLVDKNGNSELLAVYIDSAYKRQKVGTKLIETIIMNSPNIKSITTNLEVSNEGGMKFADALGCCFIEQFIDEFQGVYLHMKRLKLFVNSNSRILVQEL